MSKFWRSAGENSAYIVNSMVLCTYFVRRVHFMLSVLTKNETTKGHRKLGEALDMSITLIIVMPSGCTHMSKLIKLYP